MYGNKCGVGSAYVQFVMKARCASYIDHQIVDKRLASYAEIKDSEYIFMLMEDLSNTLDRSYYFN